MPQDTDILTKETLQKAISILEQNKQEMSCRRCGKPIGSHFYSIYGLPICNECFEKAEKTGILRLILNPEVKVGVLTEEE